MAQTRIATVVVLLQLLLLTLQGTAQATSLPPRVQVVLMQVNPLMEKKQYDQAVILLRTAQKTQQLTHAELSFALGNCLLLGGHATQAIQAFTQAVALDPQHTHAWLNLAKAYYEHKQFKQAGHAFAQAYASEGQQKPEILYYSAAAYLMAEDYAQAITAFHQLFNRHARACQPQWQEQYIHALLGAGQVRKALPLIKKLTAQYTGKQKIRWQEILLYQYLQLNMHREALQLARSLTEEHPENPRWWKALTHIHLSRNQVDQALSSLIIYSYLKPLTNRETRLLADLYLQVDIPVQAAPLYAKQLARKPESEILKKLAISYYRQGKLTSALQVLERNRSLSQKPAMLLLQAQFHYQLKQYQQAASCYRRAAKQQKKNNGQAWLMAGYAAMQGHDYATSRAALRQAAKYSAQKKAATRALHQLQQLNQVAAQ